VKGQKHGPEKKRIVSGRKANQGRVVKRATNIERQHNTERRSERDRDPRHGGRRERRKPHIHGGSVLSGGKTTQTDPGNPGVGWL